MKQQLPPQVIVVRETGGQAAANALAAICNFFIPGLGHLIQNRIVGALFWFLLLFVAYSIATFTLGIGLTIAIPLHIWCIVSAAGYRGRS